jgi:hypothetical protein
MFRIEGFVKDTKLPEILRLLDGQVYDLKAVPVHTKGDKGPKLTGTPQQVIASLPETFTLDDVYLAGSSCGHPARRMYSAVIKLANGGALKRVKKGTYRQVK